MSGDRAVDDVVRWNESEGFTPRGTVLVLSGRGESPLVYQRLSARLAADAYRVRVLGDVTADLEATVTQLKSLLAEQDSVTPRVLVGSDAGALLALRLLSQHTVTVDGLVLAGLPRSDATDTDFPSATEEIAARASCPTHQALLGDDRVFHAGRLTGDRLPDDLREPVNFAEVTVPVLGLHGADDAISPLSSVQQSYRELPAAWLFSVADGRHDVLNAINHRSVAATVVTFLERLRAGADLPEIVREESR
jgi:alpha-beta hydrolase superfamily lysophospholipase